MVAVEIAVDIPLRPEAASEARAYLRRLKGSVPDAKFDAITIIVSEIVTNSVIHSGSHDSSDISLKVSVGEGHARGEIYDDGFGFERPASPMRTPESQGGWGLYLIDTLSEDWGVSRSGGRVCVWFEIQW